MERISDTEDGAPRDVGQLRRWGRSGARRRGAVSCIINIYLIFLNIKKNLYNIVVEWKPQQVA